MGDKVKDLYDAVSKDYDVGTLQEFSTKMQDSAKRRAFYDYASKSYSLGDYNSFEGNLGVKKKDSGIPSGTPSSPTPSTSSAAPKYEFGKGSLVGTPATPVQMPGQQVDQTPHEDDPIHEALKGHRTDYTKALNEFNNSGIAQRQVSESNAQKVRPQQMVVGGDKTYGETVKNKLTGSINKINDTYDAVSDHLFPDVDKAQEYLKDKADKNKGELPQNNETVNVAIQKVNDYKEKEKNILNNFSLVDAAVNDARAKNRALDKQIQQIKEGNPGSNDYNNLLPAAMLGRLVDNFVKDKDVKSVVAHNPDLQEEYNDLSKNILTKYPEYGANLVANELSRAREAEGKNNAVANFAFGHSDYMDKLAEKLYKNDPQKLAIYNDVIKNDLNSYLDTPGIFDRAVGAIKHSFDASKRSVNELAGTKNADLVSEDLKRQGEEVNAEGKGLHEYSALTGDFLGTIAYMSAGGRLLQGMGVARNVADKAMVGLTFFGDEKARARTKFSDPKRQTIAAGLNTLGYIVAGNAVPSGKLNKVMDGLRPEINEITDKLASGAISKEVAKSQATYAFEQALKFGKAVGKQEIKGTGEMVALTGFSTALDKALGLGDKEMQSAHPNGELADVAKTTLIGNLIPSAAIGLGGVRTRSFSKNALYEMAENPKRFHNVLNDQMLTNPEGHATIDAKLQDLDHLVKTKAELDSHTDLTTEQKKQYILHDYNEKILRDKAENISNEFLKKKIDDQIKKSQAIKENIFKGKGTDVLPQEDHLTAKEYKEVSEIKDDKELFDYFMSKGQKGYKTTLEAAAAMEDPKAGIREGLKYMQDKAVENPLKFREDFGNELTEKILDRATTQEIGDSYSNLININSEDPSIPILEKLLDEREAKGEIYKPKETEYTENEEVNQAIIPAEESLQNSKNVVNLQGNEQEARNIIPEENKGSSNNPQPVGEKVGKEKQQTITERFNKVEDVTDPYDRVLQHFGSGGKIHNAEIETLFGNNKKSTENERRSRISLIAKDAPNINQLAHSLWESDTTGKHTTEDYKDAIERVLFDHNSKTSMQQDLVDRYDWEAAQEKYLNRQYGKEAIDTVEKLSEDEINHIIQLDADKTKETELQNYIDELLKSKANAIPERSTEKVPVDETSRSSPEVGARISGAKEPPRTQVPKEGESAGKEEDLTRLTHADTEKIYQESGLPLRLETSTKHFDELKSEAQAKLDKGYDYEDVAKKTMDGKYNFEDSDQLLFARRVADLKAKQKNMDVMSKDFDAAQNEIEKLSRASDVAGTITGRALQSRKNYVPTEESISDELMQKKEVLGVDVLTDKQKEETAKLFEADQQATKAYDEKIAKLEAENAKLRAETEVKKAANASPKKKRDSEGLKQEREDLKKNILDKWKKASNDNTLTAVPIPFAKQLVAIAPDIMKLMKNYVDDGIIKLDEIVKSIHKDLKEIISEKDIHNIIAGEYNEKKPTRTALAIQMFDLRTEASLINKLERLQAGEEPKSEKKKIERNKQIKDLREKIKNFESEKDRAEREKNEAMAEEEKLAKQLEKEQNAKERERLKEKAAEAKRIAKDLEKKTPEEIALQSMKTRMQSQINEVESQIKSGNFSKEAPKEPLKLDKEALDLQDKLIEARNRRALSKLRDYYQSQSKYEKGMRYAAEVLNIPRALMSSMDYSAVLRQGIIPVLSNPAMGARAAKEMFKASFSQKEYGRWFFDLKNTPRYNEMVENRLALTDSTNPQLQAREELFMSNLADKIPIAGTLVKGSERAYSMFLNKMRVDLYNRFADAMEKRGLSVENSPKQYKAMADYVNNQTGRGSVSKGIEPFIPFLNSVFFSPRLIASRINMLTYLAQPRFYKTVPKEVRKAYFKDMASFIAIGTTVLALAKLSGAQVEDDPRSADFGKIKSGKTRWDIWGGFQPYVRVASQVISGQRKSSNTGKMSELNGEGPFGTTRGDVGLSFFRGKLAPIPGLAIDLFSGRNMQGDKITYKWGGGKNKEMTVDEILKEHLLPLTVSGTQEAFQDQGTKALFTVGVPNLFGIGTQTYNDQKKKH